MARLLNVLVLLVVLLVCGCHSADPAAYWAERDAFVKTERSMLLGGKQKLTPDEEQANAILMTAKRSEYDRCYDQPCFPPSRHFFLAKPDIENSEVFSIIKRMPKGAALHGHDTGMVSTEWVVSNITYRPNLYACNRPSQLQPPPPLNLDLLSTIFSAAAPTPSTCTGGSWTLASTLRTTYGDAAVDAWFSHHFSLYTDNPAEKYPDLNSVWAAFSTLFEVTGGMLFYTPVFHDYYVQTLQELLEDNVQYLELRGVLFPTYDLDGTLTDTMGVASMYHSASLAFEAAQPVGDWFGARFIYAPIRDVDNATADAYVTTMTELSLAFPDFMIGFDLVGQEDKGHPTSDFINQLLQMREQIPNLKFFFHAGETNWQDITDMNLIDAILLNTTRIGHGYAVTKHPLVLQMAKERGIAFEVNPISNQVLELVEDLRNHPMATLLAGDYPVVVSCDDPSFWGTKGLSYDYYQMFMGMAGRDADLRFLKQLAINSIMYSAMDDAEEACALEAWAAKWDEFIAGVLRKQAPRRPEPSDACTNLRTTRVQLQTNRLH